MNLVVSKAKGIKGSFRPPSDKSLTHRAYMLGAIADGESVVRQPLQGQDCESTLQCLFQMGLSYEQESELVRLKPSKEWMSPSAPLDCGNSGTTMRLLSGLIASRPISATLVGDASLSRRPMGRIAKPLAEMGATLEGEFPPIKIQGRELQPIQYRSPVASAQIKSAVLLAALRTEGKTTVIEPHRSRDHTERMLSSLGVAIDMSVEEDGQSISGLAGPYVPTAFDFTVPGDISSAAFFMVAAALVPGSSLLVQGVGVNPTRAGIFSVFLECGVTVNVEREWVELGETVADLSLSYTPDLQPFVIGGGLVPLLIDEIPVLAVLATQCEGTTIIKDAKELRVKESDRIELIATNLRAMGADVEVFEDGLGITGPTPLKGVTVDAAHDHRIAMAFAIAGLIAEGETIIEGAEVIHTSFPSFETTLRSLVE